MKKPTLISICALALATGALAQSTVDWSRISFAAMTAQTNATVLSPFGGAWSLGGTVGPTASATTGAVFDYALLYQPYTGIQAAQPTSLAALNTWQFTGLTATNSNIAGRLLPVNPNPGATIVPWFPGVTNSIMLVGWSANLGSTWAVVSNVLNNFPALVGSITGGLAFFGTSATGYIASPDSTTVPGPTLFGSVPTPYGLPIYSLNTQLTLVWSPEPGTLALGGLGGLVLLALRRKN
jgi:hypothetical protein